MNISIDIDSEMPIFLQLIEQIKQGIVSGVLPVGTAVPSIRQLANELGVNPNTVSKAYKRLERDNVLIGRGYRGTFIHEEAIENCGRNIDDQVQKTMKNAIDTLRGFGLTDSEIRLAFANTLRVENEKTDDK